MPLPNHISVSQFSMWTRCPRQHYYRYGEGVIEPPRGAQVIGKCTHSALEYSNSRRAISGELEPWDTVADVFATEFKKSAPDAIWDETPPTTARDHGIHALKLYHNIMAPTIQPAGPEFIERQFDVALSPRVALSIVVDVIDTAGRAIDYKTASKPTKELPRDIRFQLWTYRAGLAIAAPARPVVAAVAHYIIGAKEPSVNELDAGEPSASEMAWLIRALETTRGAMERAYQSGDFPPAPPIAWWCSPKWCGYWDRCHRDW